MPRWAEGKLLYPSPSLDFSGALWSLYLGESRNSNHTLVSGVGQSSCSKCYLMLLPFFLQDCSGRMTSLKM